METLIFNTAKNLKSRFGNSIVTEFVKEGSITDAINYFDGSRDFGSIFYSEEKKYYFSTDDNGTPLISDEEINNNEENSCSVDGLRFYTAKVDNLNVEEIKAVIADNSYLIQQVLESNGYSYDDYLVAEYFNDVEEFLSDIPYEGYIEDYYSVSDVEDEDASKEFELNGKFYQRN